MSGYNNRTGIFELTWTKANYWFRRADVPAECREQKDMEFFACVLRHHGLNVLHVDGAFLKVKATPGQIWEALSGKPSDPEHEAYYTK